MGLDGMARLPHLQNSKKTMHEAVAVSGNWNNEPIIMNEICLLAAVLVNQSTNETAS